jgi:hypothetical protein
LASVCGGCLLPWSIVKFHSHDLYNTCVVRHGALTASLQRIRHQYAVEHGLWGARRRANRRQH